MLENTFVKFEHIPEARESLVYGPFELTYEELRISPDGESFVCYVNGYWWINDSPDVCYSDVIIYGGV